MTSAGSTPRFTGFPEAAFDFYRRLAEDNSKSFWTAHRAVYDEAVRAPFLALAAELEPQYGTFHLFRPNRDVRFSKDKSPYKLGFGCVTEGEGGAMYYLHLDAAGVFAATGYHQMAKDQLERFRAAVDLAASGEELVAVVAALGPAYEIGGHALSTAPRGYPRDHPRVRLLQHKGLTASKHFGTPKWLSTAKARDRIVQAWEGAASLNAWLDAHVGPSTEPPPDRF
jgi:uncharacterized protein (TIGR02453 family)